MTSIVTNTAPTDDQDLTAEAPAVDGTTKAAAPAATTVQAADVRRPAAIAVEDLTVRYGPTTALASLTLQVARGETVALLGPSGSGKSTALKAVAGFLRPTSGRISLDGRDVTELPPSKRGIGVVVQNYALFPHMRVADNVAFGLRARRMRRRETAERVDEALRMVGMSGYARRYPRELSGGQQQRVAIARALAIRPPVLLLDEPLSALDAALRADLLAELQRLRADLPDVAILYVTHDQTEALALADRIAVMRDARLVDLDDTTRLYQRPPSAFTASFLGAANLIPARVAAACTAGGSVGARVGGLDVEADPAVDFAADERALLVARPHTLTLVPAANDGVLRGRVAGTQWRGSVHRLTCVLDDPAGTEVRVDVPDSAVLPGVGDLVGLELPAQRCVLVRPEVAA